MALDQITSQAIADGAISAGDLADGSITHSKLHTTAIQDKLGYTPANETTVNNQINSALVNPTFTGQSITIPAGTTAQRPASPVNGMLRFNTTRGKLEQYDGNDWAVIDAPPIVTSITPTTEIASDDPQSIVISGSNFSTSVSVKLVGNSGTEYTPTTVTRNSSTQITITFAGNDRITGSNEPYDVKVINSSGLSSILENALNINDVPTWVTPSGSVATVVEDVTMSNITLSATDPESVGITYAIASGALPTGVSLASNGVISGTPNVNDSYNSSGVTHNFTVGASDGAQTINRSFSILRKWLDGSSSSLAVSNITQLRNLGITTEGAYWFSTSAVPTPFQAYCRFNYIDGGDWYLLLKVHNQGDMPSGSAFWTNDSLNNATDFNLTSGNWSKYATWNAFSFNRVMMEMWQGGTRRIPPIMIYNSARSSFKQAIIDAGTPANGSGLRCDSTDPQIGTSATYYNMPMKSGSAFADVGGSEDILQHYGIGCFQNNSSNGSPAEGFASTGRAGAWIGAPMDEGGHTFNAVGNSGGDSGFGFGGSAGNPAKTWSAGYAEWTNGSSTNTLPGYVWIR